MNEEKKPKISYDPMTHPARFFEAAETELRMIIRNAFLSAIPMSRILLDRTARKIITAAIKGAKNEQLREQAKRSLWAFYVEQYRTALSIGRADRMILLALLTLSDKRNRPSPDGTSLLSMPAAIRTIRRAGMDVTGSGSDVQINGVPAMQFHDRFFKERIKPTFELLIQQQPRDPDDLSGRNTLRNLAEMTVRYEVQQDHLQSMRDRGVRLVVASSHADASERCRPWQGRVYSLDGTSGTAPDGRRFVPLETATDIPYTTRAGKTYMNGLLGFNCRHYLVEYRDGLRFTKQDEAEEIRQYKITLRQRQMERKIREYETRAMMAKVVDPKEYVYAERKRAQWTQAYKDFSEANGRAWYRSRIQLI